MMKAKRKTKKTRKAEAILARMPAGLQGRRFDDETKKRALVLIDSGMVREQVAETIGTTTESLRRWMKAREALTAMSTATAPSQTQRK